jgi:hypothetical protein
MSEAWVWDRLKLNDLIPEAKDILEQELMSVGHAILIARLKPEDQKRVIRVSPQNAYHSSREGLWQHNGGRFALEKDHPEAGAGKYADVKAVSVRELETWIRDHIRFDVAHAAKAVPLVFEQTAARVSEAEAKEGRGQKVVSITFDHSCPDAARTDQERTFGNTAWKKAEKNGEPTCEHAVLGVVVAGKQYGDTFHVCVARDKCRTHWAEVVKAKEKAAKLREGGKGKQAAKVEKKAEESAAAKFTRQQAQLAAERKAWDELEPHIIADAVAQAKAIKALTPQHAKYLLDEEFQFNRDELTKHLGKNWFKTPVAAILVSAVHSFYNTGFDEYVHDVAKPLGLDIKRLEAIRDKHQPKPAAAAAPAKKKAS